MPASNSPPPPEAPAAYRMPTPTNVVIWRHVPGGEPCTAVVTRQGRQGISVLAFPPDSRVGTPKDGVRHISDPKVKTQVVPESGVWEYTTETQEFLDRLSSLETRLAGKK